MRLHLCLIALTILTVALTLSTTPVRAADTRCYEMRTYYAAPGKLDALHARFRNHTCKLFEKHGMVNVGYWVPVENPKSELIYLLSYPSREAREKSWKAFMSDPEWQQAYKASEVNGKLVDKVESVFLTATDYSPAIQPSVASPRAFELRTYRTTAGNLGRLNARFRDHTVNLFSKHGMTHIGYWTPTDAAQGASDTLVYILAHKSKEAADASFKSFRDDPDWIRARKASEEAAGGSLTLPQPDGVKSRFLTATEYSAIR
jgi:hypothetical protein